MLGTIEIDGKTLLNDLDVSTTEIEDSNSGLKDLKGSFKLSSSDFIHTQEFIDFCNISGPFKLVLEDGRSLIISVADRLPCKFTSLIYFNALEVLTQNSSTS